MYQCGQLGFADKMQNEIQQQLPDQTEINKLTCPKCGKAKLCIRQQRKSGDFFIGCQGYPNCKYTKNMPKDVEN